GDGKPFIRSADGFELLDLSDWDHNSRVVVDGNAFELVRLYPTSSVDYSRNRVAETLQGDGWSLEREITLDSAGLVHIVHSFVARQTVHRVDLSVAYTHTYLSNLRAASGQVTAGVTRQTRQEAASGSQAPPAYQVQVTGDSSGGPIPTYRPGDAGPLGATSFVADMSATDPRIDERTPLGADTIRIQPAS
ncbi:MAG: hypothetical protein JO247_24145, partial [Chloroflexi bacterium]|nr:hypothetical protein [Chloroflexota bacterium]